MRIIKREAGSSNNRNSSPTISDASYTYRGNGNHGAAVNESAVWSAFVRMQVREQVQMHSFELCPRGMHRDRITVARFDLNSSRVRRRPHINSVYSPVDTQSSGGGGGGVGVVEGDGTLLAMALIITAGGALYCGTCNTTGVFTDRSTGSSCTGGPAACNERKRARQWLATTINRSVSTHWA